MAELIDRRQVRAESRAMLRDAQVSPRGFFALYLVLTALLSLLPHLLPNATGAAFPVNNPVELFFNVLVRLMTVVLTAGLWLYCLAIRQGQRAEYLTLFDGFSFVGKIILLALIKYVFISLWMCLFIIPGFVAMYRYQFALLNLCENPALSPMEALELSKRQTVGYKSQLLMLDVSFFGWFLLVTLPMLYFYCAFSMELMGGASGIFLWGTTATAITQLLLGNLVGVLAGLFYLPLYYTMQTGYFEIAKRTSGLHPLPPLSDGTQPPEPDNFF